MKTKIFVNLADKLYISFTMNKLIATGFFFLLFLTADASPSDSSRALQVGDSVFIGSCAAGAKAYKYIQYYRKTRFPNPAATYNKETGEDFYEFFFLDGDYDVKFLNCDYALKKYRVLSLRIFADKNTGADRNVMFLDIGLNTVAWVELDGAVPSMEVYVE